jgi:hypothetical protein
MTYETKYQIAERITKVEISHSNLDDIKKMMSTLWVVPADYGSMRLSVLGFELCKKHFSEHYSVDINGNNYPSEFAFLRQLNDKIHCPFFLYKTYKEIILFDKKIATVSKLYENFDKYLEKVNPRDK